VSGHLAPPPVAVHEGDVFRPLVEGWNPMMSCVVIRRAVLAAAGTFDEALHVFEDYDLLLRLAAAGVPFLC
jgi:GT2 family glycosyltransferase